MTFPRMLVRDIELPNSNNQHSGSICHCQIQRDPADFCPSDVRLAASYRNNRIHLYAAALSGNWTTAESIFEEDPSFVNSSVTEEHQTALHVAAGANQTDFVRKLVNWRQTQKRDLELQDENGNTAFCLAVIAGSVPIAKILLKEVPRLAVIRGGQNSIPLFIAVIYGRHDMAQFLFEETEKHLNHLEPEHVREIFFTCIQTDMFDLALKLLTRYKDLAVARHTNEQTALHMLAGKTPTTFYRKRPGIVKMLINQCKESEDNEALKLLKELWEIFLSQTQNVIEEISSPFNLLFKAAKLGNSEYLAALIRLYPELTWETDDMNRTIFHIAVMHRHVNVFNQIYSTGSIKDVVVTYKIPRYSSEADNMLYLAAKLPLPHELNVVSGAALQMQRELLWFQVIESMVLPSDREANGMKKITPRELFSQEHTELQRKGEKWMRETSHSCMIVATLTAGGVYAAGFSTTISSNDSKGLHLHTLFHVLAVSEAVALSFSIISTLMFLYIHTSRYAEKDFLRSLPMKLIAGLLTLFIALMAMVVAFGSAFLLAYRDSYNHYKFRCVPLIVSGFVCLPVAFFVLVRSLLRDVLYSTFCSRSLFRPEKFMFVI